MRKKGPIYFMAQKKLPIFLTMVVSLLILIGKSE